MEDQLREVETITFRDLDSGDEAAFIIRSDSGCIGLATTLKEYGDVEVFVSIADCKRLLKALEAAIAMAEP